MPRGSSHLRFTTRPPRRFRAIRTWALLAVAVCAPALAASTAAPAPAIDFNRDVRPILSDKCFSCHGPDEGSRKGKLRLDTRDGATRTRDGVTPVLPGRSPDSELWLRVTSGHDDEVMPPPDAKLGRLTPAEIDTLRRWIDAGAPYDSHWAFVPLAAPALPPTPATAHPIDRFVRAHLATRNLVPQPEADRATLIRRVSFDLTGLPPTPAEVAAFVQDSRPDAYERVVDRLLASPRYGERLAVDWLDVARYADSFGFQVDREREMWPWRDWVIGAFNRNLPWDQFVTWQLAGDLLPGATDEQILATAFNRLHAQESEGGSVEEEYRVNYVNDRTTTFGTAFLGLTLECARCHDHKYDPISQKDYYQLFAFFDDIDEAGLYSFFTPSMPTPAMWLQTGDEKRGFAAATAAVAAEEAKLVALADSRRTAFETWLADPVASAAAGLAEAGPPPVDLAPPSRGQRPRLQPEPHSAPPEASVVAGLAEAGRPPVDLPPSSRGQRPRPQPEPHSAPPEASVVAGLAEAGRPPVDLTPRSRGQRPRLQPEPHSASPEASVVAGLAEAGPPPVDLTPSSRGQRPRLQPEPHSASPETSDVAGLAEAGPPPVDLTPSSRGQRPRLQPEPHSASPETSVVAGLAEAGRRLPDELARFDFDQRLPAGSPAAPGATATPNPAETDDPPSRARAAKADRFASALDAKHSASTPRENLSVPGRDGAGQALQLTGDHPVNTTLGNFSRHDPFTISLWLQTPDARDRAVILHRSRAWTDAASRGYELLLEDGRLKWSLIHFWPGDAISVRAVDAIPPRTWVHVAVSHDGSGRAAGLQVFVNGGAVRTDIIRDHLTKNITGGGGDTLALGERFRDRGFKGGLVDDLRVFARALTPLEVRELHSPGTFARTVADATRQPAAASPDVFAAYLSRHDEAWRAQLAALTAARAARTRLAEAAREIMVMRELPQPRTAYVLKRGDYDQRGDAVRPGTPAALPPFPADSPRNRLGLARWLTEPRHPLLARVTVNRFWQSLFGRGLVRTAEDFGSQGDRPELPALLDWLAAEFVRTGWDVKALLRTIVRSDTYRQRSFAPGPVMADDPENALLARGPRHRLPAEMIRDQALAVSGLLVERVGGPPVFTYDHPESFKPAPAGKGEALYRRSLYTFWRRNGPAPVLEAFDVPKRVVCVARRDTTNTPLHAFVLLNGPQFTEAARVLAERLWRATAAEPGALPAQAFLHLLGRAPDAAEQRTLGRLHAEQLAWYRARPAEAAAYLQIGDTPRDASLPAAELAAATVLINTLLNHDGCVVKR